MPGAPRFYFGWYVVFACFMVALFAWGLGFYGHAIYLAQLREKLGWSTALISTATTVYYIAGALLSAWFGSIMERLGPRLAIIPAILAMAAGSAAVPFVTAPWQLYAAYLLMAVGWSGMSIVAITLVVARWFVRRRGFAISLALNGASSGGILTAPLLVWAIEKLGFADAVLAMVAAMLLLLLPLVLFAMSDGPASRGLAVDGDAGATAEPARAAAPASPWTRSLALRSRAFWIVALPFTLGLAAQVGFLMHQIAFLSPALGATGAGLALMLASIAAVVGRVGLGFFIDRLDQRLCAALSFLSQAAALLAMASSDAPLLLYAASIIFGLSVGNVITYPALVVQREFAPAAFAIIVGFSTAISQIAYALAPGILGHIRDLSGGYGAVLGCCIAVQLLAAVLVLQRPRPSDRRP